MSEEEQQQQQVEEAALVEDGTTDNPVENVEPEELSPKRFHMFISYRVRTDADTAEKLCDKLQGLSLPNEPNDFRLRCFLDKQNLTSGADYRVQFLDGLHASCLFLPVISMGVLAGMTGITEDSEDNVLLEWETALVLARRGGIHILPILVGEVEITEKGTFYKRFDSFWMASQIPDVSVRGSVSGLTARAALLEIFKLQGVFLNPLDVPDKLAAIVERFSQDFWPRYRESWEEREKLGVEPVFTCVQCGGDFRNSENGEGVCRFHATGDKVYSGGQHVNSCCQKSDAGCRRKRHRNKHHCDYPYASFHTWMGSIVAYTDESERLAEVSARDHTMFNGREMVWATAGRVLKKVDNDRNKLYVQCRCPEKTWFWVFSKDEIELVDHKMPLVEYKHPLGYGLKVEWRMWNGEVEGLELSCWTKTTPSPPTCRLRFAWPEIPDNNGPRAVSVEYDETPEFNELPLLPSSTYTLPTGRFYKGNILKYPIGRKPDTSLPSYAHRRTPLKTRLVDTQPRHSGDRDVLEANVSVLNVSGGDVTVVAVRAYARLRGDPGFEAGCDPEKDGDEEAAIKLSTDRWIKCSSVLHEIKGDPVPQQPRQPPPPHFHHPHHAFNNMPGRPGHGFHHGMHGGGGFPPPPIFFNNPPPPEPPKGLPAMVPSNGSLTLKVAAVIKTQAYNGRKLSRRHLDFSWIAFHTNCPVVVDFEFEDMLGRVFGLLVEYPVPKMKIDGPGPNDLLYLFTDVPDEWNRNELKVMLPEEKWREAFTGSKSAWRSSLDVLMIKYSSIARTVTVSNLRHIVSRALQATGDAASASVVAVDATDDFYGDQSGANSRVFMEALVDVRRRAVFALKIRAEVYRDEVGCLASCEGCVAVPPYGDALREDEGLAVEAVGEVTVKMMEGATVVEDVVAASVGTVQSMAEVPLRLTGAALGEGEEEKEEKGKGDGAAVPALDTEELIKAVRETVRAEVEDAVRDAMKVQMVRLKEMVRGVVLEAMAEVSAGVVASVKEAVAAVPPPSVVAAVAEPIVNGTRESKVNGTHEVEDVVTKVAKLVRDENEAQLARIEEVVTATVTAATAVSLKQQEAKKKKGIWG
ncbi:hypothetical protein HDU96_000592 [Phlyctochytrium bullatum]|nr:hypothetical protein HDU96_000592 [Phlyctochytrium bullatum]